MNIQTINKHTIVSNKIDVTNFDRMAVTIYIKSEFGYSKIEAKLRQIVTGSKYAQYNNAMLIYYTPKGKRNEQIIRLSYDPQMVILQGHGHFNPDNGFVDVDSKFMGLTVKKSKYLCYDKRYVSEFDSMLAEYLELNKVNVIFDSRGVDTH